MISKEKLTQKLSIWGFVSWPLKKKEGNHYVKGCLLLRRQAPKNLPSLKGRAGFGLGPEPESPKISPKMAGPKKPEARKQARRAFCPKNILAKIHQIKRNVLPFKNFGFWMSKLK